MKKVVYIEAWTNVSVALEQWDRLCGQQTDQTIRKPYSFAFFDYCQVYGLSGLALSATTSRISSSYLSEQHKALRAETISKQLCSGWRFHLGEVRHAIKVIRKCWNFDPDVIYVDSGAVEWIYLLALSRRGRSIIPILHNTVEPVASRRSKARTIISKLNQFFWRKVACFLSISDEATLSAQLSAAPNNPRCIRYYAHFRKFADIIKPCTDRPPSHLRLLFSGRIEASKGIYDLVDACSTVSTRFPLTNITLAIAGTGTDLEALRQVAEGTSSFQMVALGSVDARTLSSEYACAHLVVVPTRPEFPEGFAQVIPEALMYGTPAIASTNVPAAKEFADSTLVFPAGSHQELANCISRLIEEPDLLPRLEEAAAKHSETVATRSPGLYEALVQVELGAC